MSAEVEAAVQAVKSVEALEIMGKLLYNCAVSPREDKFRRVKLTNKKVADTIGSTHGEGCWGSDGRQLGVAVLVELGQQRKGICRSVGRVGFLASAVCMHVSKWLIQ